MKETQIEKIRELQQALWEYAEPAFEEYRSSAALADFLEAEGFEVERGICGMDTAFAGRFGSGRPVISVLAEYDSLFGLQQEADVDHVCQPAGKETGHGCGHHLLGLGAVAAALEIQDYLATSGQSGTVQLVGCPAEEAGSGKAYLARDGFFATTDACLTWHPAIVNAVQTGSAQSCIAAYFHFKGVSSHAAASPQAGRSALDACELMNIGVNYLREHMEDSDRVHYAYTDTGGRSPNVVQSTGTVYYFIRSRDNAGCLALYERVKDCARGAALMTGTSMEIEFGDGLSNVLPNFVLEDVLEEAFFQAGPAQYTEEERAYAARFKDSFTGEPESLQAGLEPEREVRKHMAENPLCDVVFGHVHSEHCDMGSTDVGDVSWVVPTAQISANCFSYGAGSHSWQWVAQGKSSIALKGALKAGEVMALAARTLFKNPDRIEAAWDEHTERTAGRPYQCLIPADIKPHKI